MARLFSKIFKREKTAKPDAQLLEVVDPGSVLDSQATKDPPTSVAGVFRCLRILADTVGSLPLTVRTRRPDGTFADDTEGELPYLLSVAPNNYVSAFEHWRQFIWQYYLCGTSYILPVKSSLDGSVMALILCSPFSVWYDRVGKTYNVNDSAHGLYGTYAEEDIIVVRGPSFDGIDGEPLLSFMKVSVEAAQAGDKETRDRFAKGGNVRGFFTNPPLTTPGIIYNDKEMKRAAEQKDYFFRSGGRMTYLPGGMQFKELMQTSADMQFLESRKFSVIEICRFFGIPPTLAFADSSTNYKSAEMANVAFLTNTLNPLLRQIEMELNRKLLGRTVRRKIEFDRSSMFACDLETRVKWQASRIAAGLDTPNEARLADNRPPVEGGDNILLSANLKGLSALLNEGAGPTDDPNNRQP